MAGYCINLSSRHCCCCALGVPLKCSILGSLLVLTTNYIIAGPAAQHWGPKIFGPCVVQRYVCGNTSNCYEPSDMQALDR